MSSGRRRCGASTLTNQRTGIEARRRGGRCPGWRPGNEGSADRGHCERHVFRGAPGCGGWDTPDEVAQSAGRDRLHPSGLASRGTPSRNGSARPLPFDEAALSANADSQLLGHGGPNNETRQTRSI